jgi:hypothetical protein
VGRAVCRTHHGCSPSTKVTRIEPHIIDHYHPGLGGYLPQTIYGLTPVEYVAEYFAGCVLMPKNGGTGPHAPSRSLLAQPPVPDVQCWLPQPAPGRS